MAEVIVPKGNDRIFHVALTHLVRVIGGEDTPIAVDISKLTEVSVSVSHHACSERVDVPHTITPEGLLRVELTSETQRTFGNGAYTLHFSAREANSDYHDGYRDIAKSVQLCRVVDAGADDIPPAFVEPTPLELVVFAGLRGPSGRDGRDGKDGARGADGQQGAPAPAPRFEFRRNPVTGHSYLYANGEEVLDEAGGHVPLHVVRGDLIHTTEMLSPIDMRPRFYGNHYDNAVHGYNDNDRQSLYGKMIADGMTGVTFVVGNIHLGVVPGWSSPYHKDYYSCLVKLRFNPATTQPIYALLLQRVAPMNLVVRFKLHARGAARLVDTGSDRSSTEVECEANTIYELSLPFVATTGVVLFSAGTSEMPRKGESMMTLLDWRFVDVTPARS